MDNIHRELEPEVVLSGSKMAEFVPYVSFSQLMAFERFVLKHRATFSTQQLEYFESGQTALYGLVMALCNTLPKEKRSFTYVGVYVAYAIATARYECKDVEDYLHTPRIGFGNIDGYSSVDVLNSLVGTGVDYGVMDQELRSFHEKLKENNPWLCEYFEKIEEIGLPTAALRKVASASIFVLIDRQVRKEYKKRQSLILNRRR